MKLHLDGFLPFFVSPQRENIDVVLNEPTILGEILVHLGIPVSEIYMTVLNGESVTLEETLVRDSDVVRLIPPMDGG